MSVNYNPATPTDGLVLCIDPSNPRCYPGSGTTVFDLSGNNNNGTLTNGASVINTRGGRALDFDGVNDFITTNITLTNEFGFSCWFNRRTSGSDNSRVIWGNTADADTYIAAVKLTSIDVQSNTTGTLKSFTGFTINNNTWYHMTVTRNTLNNVSVFINGAESTSGAQSIAGTFTLNGIGRYFNAIGINSPYQWDGNLDDIRLYSRILTPSEIRQLFESKRGRFL